MCLEEREKPWKKSKTIRCGSHCHNVTKYQTGLRPTPAALSFPSSTEKLPKRREFVILAAGRISARLLGMHKQMTVAVERHER